MGSAVETANMEGGRYLILAVLGLALLHAVTSNPRKIREAEEDVTTTVKSVGEKIIESEVEEIIESDDEEQEETEVEDQEENEVSDEEEFFEHEKNCHKCRKASFKYRKDLFCGKCVTKGLVSLESNDGKNLHCKKCRKSRFRFKNGEFCEMKCPEQMKQEVIDETTTEVAEETTTTAPVLGPLGSLLRFFVVSNTWGQAKPTVVDE